MGKYETRCLAIDVVDKVVYVDSGYGYGKTLR